jgi:hypothetical protein
MGAQLLRRAEPEEPGGLHEMMLAAVTIRRRPSGSTSATDARRT